MSETPNRMPLMKKYGPIFGAFGFVIALFFQNCDGGFHFDPNSGELSSLGASGGQFQVTMFSPTGLVVPEGQALEGGTDYKVVASGVGIDNALIMWTLLSNNADCVLRPGTTAEVRYVACGRAGTVSIQTLALWEDGSSSTVVQPRTSSAVAVDQCGPSTATRVVFRIANGTLNAAWNSSTAPVVVNVGQVLRICNDDSVRHQLHTDGAPCVHQPDSPEMNRGMYYDCVISNTNNVNTTTGVYNGLYDHNRGNNAMFYVRPYNGEALYASTAKTGTSNKSCATCHGMAIANSTKRGRTFDQIKAGLALTACGGDYTTPLTDDEIRAIAFALRM